MEIGGGGGRLLSLDWKRGYMTIFFSEGGWGSKEFQARNLPFYWKMDYGQNICHKIIFGNAKFFVSSWRS